MKQINKFTKIMTIMAVMAMGLVHALPAIAELTGAQTITICSGYSIKSVTIDEYGRPVPQAPEQSKKNCSICITGHTPGLPAKDLAFKKPVFEKDKAEKTPQTFFFKESFSLYQSRGPPELS